jgi:prevent-host-death family protein
LEIDADLPGSYILARISGQKENAMPRHSWSVQDAKNQFSAVVEAAKRAPQTVTKHGKPAVVVIDAADYERLRKVVKAKAPSFKDLLLAMPQDDGSFERPNIEMRGVKF